MWTQAVFNKLGLVVLAWSLVVFAGGLAIGVFVL